MNVSRVVYLLVLYSSFSIQALAQISIHGVVTDANTRMPVSCAMVSAVGDQSAAPDCTDDAGQFDITLNERIKAGEPIRIRVTKKGYLPADKKEVASTNQTIQVALRPDPSARLHSSVQHANRPYIQIPEPVLEPDKDGALHTSQDVKIAVAGGTPAYKVTAIVGSYGRYDHLFVPGDSDFKWMKFIIDKANNGEIPVAGPDNYANCLWCQPNPDSWKGKLPFKKYFRDWAGIPIVEGRGDLSIGPYTYPILLPPATSGLLVAVIYGDIIYYEQDHTTKHDSEFCYYIPSGGMKLEKCEGFNEMH